MSGINGFDPNYIDAAVAAEVQAVATAAPGSRNQALNRAAFSLAGFPNLPAARITRQLRDAAERSGLLKDDGATSVLHTIQSGLKAGRNSPRAAPTNRHERRREAAISRQHGAPCAKAAYK